MSSSRRRLLLRDTLTFLGLTLLTIALFTVTLFLFRSFASHRTELGRRWSDRGRAAMAAGQPEQAIGALRTALSYAPDERPYELLLAQALEQGGHTEEAFNYFSGLWDAQPGSGFINLQLARLAAVRRDPQQAINFYRASIYGTWEGDGVLRRRAVRLELAQYLLQHGDASTGRLELLIAEGNADGDATFDLALGRLFENARDNTDALGAYQKAIEADPKNVASLVGAGRLAYSMGDFELAERMLQRALATSPADGPLPDDQLAYLRDLLRKDERILDLLPLRRLSSDVRARRLLTLRTIARQRLDACAARPEGLPPEMQEISSRWAANSRTFTRAALLRDSSVDDELMNLVFDTETSAETVCGTANGDDALALQIARNPKAVDR